MRITVKVGSNVLTRNDGTLDVTRMSALVDQIVTLRRQGVEVVLVSSGAVASGRSELRMSDKLDDVSQRQLFSAVGQAKLINKYYELFRDQGFLCGQVLTTKESLSTEQQYKTQQNCMEVMLQEGVIPIVNENDTISVTELMFTDNDELSGLVTTMMKADLLILLSNIDGIYTGNPSDPDSKLIRVIGQNTDVSHYIKSSKSSAGRGGMVSKHQTARNIAAQGIEVIIANGKRDDILLNLIQVTPDGEMVVSPLVPCTRFV
ncbi:MAG: glutamate 5-kinase [Bacteroidales bacterium]|nr:glutamate 5-kinase [Candidatus Liminaster caballi]